MRKYISLLKSVRDNGRFKNDKRVVREDNITINLTDGFPLLTTVEVDHERASKELLWFISGDCELGVMADDPVWSSIVVTAEDLKEFIAARPELTDDQIKKNILSKVGYVNASESLCWRNIVTSNVNYYWPETAIDRMPSDKVKIFSKAYDDLSDLDKETVTKDKFMKLCFKQSIDQLNNLVNSLSDKSTVTDIPVLTAGVAVEPYRDISPQENIILDKICISSLVTAFSCTITETPSITQKDELDMKVYIRNANAFTDIPYLLCQYGLLLSLLAKVTNLTASRLQLIMTDLYVEKTDLEEINKTIARSPTKPKELELSEIVDLFSIDLKSIKFK